MSWTPIWEMSEPSGPIENGTTYIVRPFMQPSKSSLERRPHLGRGRASCWSGRRPPRCSEQMKVRSSTRATSPGSEQGEVGVRAASRRRGARRSRRRSELCAEAVVLLGGAVAPVDGVGLGELGDLLDPARQGLVPGGRLGSRRLRRSSVSCSTPIWGAAVGRRPQSAGSAACRGRDTVIVAQTNGHRLRISHPDRLANRLMEPDRSGHESATPRPGTGPSSSPQSR